MDWNNDDMLLNVKAGVDVVMQHRADEVIQAIATVLDEEGSKYFNYGAFQAAAEYVYDAMGVLGIDELSVDLLSDTLVRVYDDEDWGEPIRCLHWASADPAHDLMAAPGGMQPPHLYAFRNSFADILESIVRLSQVEEGCNGS